MFKEFKKFILRGSVVDLAVGLAIGAAFNNVVNTLVKDMIDPLVSLLYGGNKLSDLQFVVNGKGFRYGDVINSVITFLIVAIVVFFFVVKPINKLSELAFRGKSTDEEGTKKCPYCLGKIPKEATKCMFCTSKLEEKKA